MAWSLALPNPACERRSFLLVALAAGLASCSPAKLVRCEEGPVVTDRKLVDLAADKIVRQSLASSDQEVRYASLAAFYHQNPACCYVSKPDNFSGGTMILPFDGEVELTIRYRREVSSPTPYRLRRVAMGPCPSDAEESEQRLTLRQQRESARYKLGRAVI